MAETAPLNVRLVPPVNRGGLSEQFEQTAAALTRLGVSVSTGDASDAAPDEIVHLFDAPAIFETLQQFLAARARGARVVVNPVYWDAARFFRQGLAGIDEPRGDGAVLERRVRHAQRVAEHAARQLLFRHADALLPLSPSEAELVARDFGVPQERMIVAPNGIAPIFTQTLSGNSFMERYGVREFVLCAGRIDAVKNQRALIRALRSESLTLVLIGKAETEAYLALCQQEAQSSRGRVLFLPPLPPKELAAAYAAARVHALVSWFDVAPLVALEAAASGCQIVLTTESGGRDYFGDAAWYCDPGDDSSIHDAVCSAYMASPNAALRAHVVREYTWTRTAQQTRAAYEHARGMGNPTDDESYHTDLESALLAFSEYARLQELARAGLWREKTEIAQQCDAYANGRVLRVLNTLQNFLKRRT